jgi:hypothetical protein
MGSTYISIKVDIHLLSQTLTCHNLTTSRSCVIQLLNYQLLYDKCKVYEMSQEMSMTSAWRKIQHGAVLSVTCIIISNTSKHCRH